MSRRTVSPFIAIIILCAVIPVSGAITYTLNKASNPTADQQDAYSKITAAMDRAVDYYNTYTSISKALNISYEPSVQTADGSFSGSIRFGSNRSYMVVLTALHEIAHTVGVGTTREYQNLIINGVFTGTHATAMLRELTGDPNAVLKGDQQHFWPYGLNYASEYESDDDYVFHCKIVNAIYQDLFNESLYKVCRLRSKSDGRYMAATPAGKLALSPATDGSSIVRIVNLGDEAVFRLEFGDKVLDIPNESKTAGVAASLYSWNGGNHQREAFEFEPGEQYPGVVRMKMVNSGLYLRADGDNIVQDNASSTRETQLWELIDTTDAVGTVAAAHRSGSTYRLMDAGSCIIISGPADGLYNAHLAVVRIDGKSVLSVPVNGRSRIALPRTAHGVYSVSLTVNGRTSGRVAVFR